MGDPQTIHDHETESVREGKGLVLVAGDQGASSTLVFDSNPNYGRCTAVDLLEDTQSCGVAQAVQDKCVPLSDNEVGGVEGLAFADQTLLNRFGCLMTVLAAVDKSIVCGGIHERPARWEPTTHPSRGRSALVR